MQGLLAAYRDDGIENSTLSLGLAIKPVGGRRYRFSLFAVRSMSHFLGGFLTSPYLSQFFSPFISECIHFPTALS